MLKKLRNIAVILAFAALSALFMGANAKEDPEPQAYVLMEAETHTVLNELNADKRAHSLRERQQYQGSGHMARKRRQYDC